VSHPVLFVQVTAIQRASEGSGWVVQSKSENESGSSQVEQEYDSVILAAPFHSTGIEIDSPLNTSIPPQPYVHLHVTLLTTTAPHPNPTYFGLKPTDKVPQVILTTTSSSSSSLSAAAPHPDLEFNSLTYHGIVTTREVHRPGRTVDWIPEYVVKIFSKEPVSDVWLERMFGWTGEPGGVGWVRRKEWDAYPHLPPTTAFPPVRIDDGFYYVNAFEPYVIGTPRFVARCRADRGAIGLFRRWRRRRSRRATSSTCSSRSSWVSGAYAGTLTRMTLCQSTRTLFSVGIARLLPLVHLLPSRHFLYVMLLMCYRLICILVYIKTITCLDSIAEGLAFYRPTLIGTVQASRISDIYLHWQLGLRRIQWRRQEQDVTRWRNGSYQQSL
jgi:hypothetical protein